MAHAVVRRTNEIGIRMALGAERGHIIWLVLKESLLLVESELSSVCQPHGERPSLSPISFLVSIQAIL